jgi:YVTN family beta-propeller protein
MIKRISKTLYIIVSIIILNYVLINLQSCQQDFVSNSNTVSQFPSEIDAIFNTPYTNNNLSCTTPSCHASENSARGLDLVNWQNTMNGSDNGTMVIPYSGFWSHMISYLNTDTNVAPVTYIDTNSVLYSYHKIGASKVSTIMNWIDNGAKNKDGQVAFTDIPRNDKGFITNQAADVVAVIQPNEKRVVRLISVGGRPSPTPLLPNIDAPHYLKLSPDENYFYISLIQEGYIEKYDANTFARVGRMAAGESPAHVEISPDGNFGYVTNFESSGTVTTTRKFNTSTMTVTDVFSAPQMTGPHGMALTRDGNYLYVTSEIGEYIFRINTNNFYASDSTFIKSPIDPTVPPTGSGTSNFRPYQVLLSPDESLLFISCRGANQVRIYDAQDLHQVNSIQLPDNSFPLLMKFTEDGNYLFVCDRNNNSVTIINRALQTIITTITDVGIQPHGVDFTADGQYAIIACETQSGFDGHHPQIGSRKVGVSRLIKISNLTLLPDRLEMGSFPAGIAIIK